MYYENKKTILLVDDEEQLALSLKDDLTNYGYNVLTTDTGKNAIKIVKMTPGIDLILMDIAPGRGEDGIEAVKIILEQHNIPIVFLTDHSEPEVIKKTETITSYGYVLKQSDTAVLDASIKMAFKLHSAHQTIKEKETALRESEEKFRDIFNQAAEGILIMPVDGTSLTANESFARMHGYASPEEMSNLRLSDLDTPASARLADERLQRLLAGETINFEVDHRHRDGHSFPLNVCCKVIQFGEKQYFVGFHQDITERRRIEKALHRQLEEKEIIVRESHHRIKNNITSIASLLTLQAGSVKSREARSALLDATGRVHSMAGLYNKMLATGDYRNIEAGPYLSDLLDTIAALYEGAVRITIEKHFNQFTLGRKQIFPLGIIVNELITNSMKYAFAGRKSGKIRVSAVKKENRIKLTVHDNGNGLPEGSDINSSNGFGFRLVKMMSEQLAGSFKIENRSGVRCTLEFSI